jgi:hypothetical protein
VRFVRDVNDRFYDRVTERKHQDRLELTPAAAVYYADLPDDDKYARLTAMLAEAEPESAEAADLRSHLASLDAKRHGGIA